MSIVSASGRRDDEVGAGFEGDEHEEDADLAGSGGGALPSGSREHEGDEPLDALSDVSDNSDLFMFRPLLLPSRDLKRMQTLESVVI